MIRYILIQILGGACLASLLFATESRHPLPTELSWANDVRWAGDDAVFVASSITGVFHFGLSGESRSAVRQIGQGGDPGEFWLPHVLGTSKEYMAVAAPVRSLAWKRPGEKNLAGQFPFDAILDLDLQGDRIVVLGARKDKKNRFAPDGAIVWTGTLGANLADLRPVFYSASGPGAPSLDACGLMEIGAVRFLADGSFLVVPGVEPGVFHVNRDGRVLRTWRGDELGFDAGCGLSDEEIEALALDEPGRWDWVNRRRSVDDVLPLQEGPALVVRTVQSGETHWTLKILKPKGIVESREIPIVSPSPLAHLRGDVRGERIVLLIAMRGFQETGQIPEHPPRIYVFDQVFEAGSGEGGQ